jgi:acetylornithine deacetylase/succinyl-diaminopimelate desuccinylase-like protein
MIPGETVEQVETELRRELTAALAESPEIEFRLEFLEWNEPVQTPLDSPLIAALQRNATAVLGHRAEIWAVPYGCDVRNFVYDANIPAVNFGAGDYRVCHGPDEFVPVAGLLACARAVMGTTIDLLS